MTPRLAPVTARTSSRRLRKLLGGATATLGLLAFASAPALARPSDGSSVPAAGDVVTCNGVGELTAADGYLEQHETTRLDQQGRAHVLFTIAAHHVTLTGPDRTSYRLLGGGFDRVLYRTTDVTGEIVREQTVFRFDVVGPHGVVGVVRFRLDAAAGRAPHVHDASTCQLPNMS